jgi:hypothetical protein
VVRHESVRLVVRVHGIPQRTIFRLADALSRRGLGRVKEARGRGGRPRKVTRVQHDSPRQRLVAAPTLVLGCTYDHSVAPNPPVARLGFLSFIVSSKGRHWVLIPQVVGRRGGIVAGRPGLQ